jgi:hypothetical protein
MQLLFTLDVPQQQQYLAHCTACYVLLPRLCPNQDVLLLLCSALLCPSLLLLLLLLLCSAAAAAVVEGWLDLAKLVASEGSKAKSPYEELAYQIGKQQGFIVQEPAVLQAPVANDVQATEVWQRHRRQQSCSSDIGLHA